MKPPYVLVALLFSGFARAALADMWSDNGSWVVSEPAAFACQHRETLSRLSEYARDNDHKAFERALDEHMADECALLRRGTRVLLLENLPRESLRRIQVIGEMRFLWLPLDMVHQELVTDQPAPRILRGSKRATTQPSSSGAAGSPNPSTAPSSR